MARVRLERRLLQAGVLLALLSPVAWLCTGWHLAVEAHHVRALVDGRDHDHGHDHDDRDDHDDEGVPPEDEGHHRDDHLIPDSLRPDHGTLEVELVTSEPGHHGWALATTPTPAAAPFDDVPPATDPPIESRRPRAPPAG